MEHPQELITPGAKELKEKSAAPSEPAAASAAPAAAPPTAEEIAVVESLVEANVQRSLDSLDAWSLTAPFRGKTPDQPPDPNKCTKERHNCNLETDDPNSLCVGCMLYKRIVRDRTAFPAGGQSAVCDYMGSGIAEPLIFAFIKNGAWLNPANKFEGNWFVKHPITFAYYAPTAMAPVVQTAIRRNRVRLLQGDKLLADLGLFATRDSLYHRLHGYWKTEAGGIIYSLDELLEILGPITLIATSAQRAGIKLEDVSDIKTTATEIQKLYVRLAQ